MDKQKLMEWLNVQARLQKESIANNWFDKEYVIGNIVVRDGVQLEGILLLCETLGLAYEKEDWKCEQNVADEISFIHNGVRFYGLENYRVGEK